MAKQIDHRPGPSKPQFWKGLRTRAKYDTRMIDSFTQRPGAYCTKGTDPGEINPLGFERPFGVL